MTWHAGISATREKSFLPCRCPRSMRSMAAVIRPFSSRCAPTGGPVRDRAYDQGRTTFPVEVHAEDHTLSWRSGRPFRGARHYGPQAAQEDLRHRTRGLPRCASQQGPCATLNMDEVLQTTTDGVTKAVRTAHGGPCISSKEIRCACGRHAAAAADLPRGASQRAGCGPPAISERRSRPERPSHVHDMATTDLLSGGAFRRRTEDLRHRTLFSAHCGGQVRGYAHRGFRGETAHDLRGRYRPVPDPGEPCRPCGGERPLYTSGRQYASELEQQIVERKKAEENAWSWSVRLLHAQKLESLASWPEASP